MKWTVTNMVCQRCIYVVQQILQQHSIEGAHVQIGSITFAQEPATSTILFIKKDLADFGFHILDNKIEQIIVAIKARVLAYIDLGDIDHKPKMSSFITQEIFYDYSYLSELFSTKENKTIEQYFIELRLDKVKEQLVYSHESLSNIAYGLGFSSPQHLAAQFKQYTGITPTAFRGQHSASKIA
jgi:AraC family transcriptional regulator